MFDTLRRIAIAVACLAGAGCTAPIERGTVQGVDLARQCLVQLRSNRFEIVRLNGSTRLVRIPGNNHIPWGRVAPDGSYSVGTDGDSLIAVDSRGQVLWTVPKTPVSGMPAISSDGAKVAFAGRNRHLTVYSISTGRLEVFDVVVNNPEWAPSSSRLAYDDGTDVHVFDTSSGAKSKAGAGTEPSWLPGANEIAVRVNSQRIEVVTVQTLERRSFLSASTRVSMPRWSADGRVLYYTRRGGLRWWSIDWSGSEPSQIVVRTVQTGEEASVGEVYKANPGNFTWTISESLCGPGQ